MVEVLRESFEQEDWADREQPDRWQELHQGGVVIDVVEALKARSRREKALAQDDIHTPSERERFIRAGSEEAFMIMGRADEF